MSQAKIKAWLWPDDVFRKRKIYGNFSGSGVNRFVVFGQSVRSALQFDAVGEIDLEKTGSNWFKTARNCEDKKMA